MLSAELFGGGLAIGGEGCFSDGFSHADVDGQERTHFKVKSILFGVDLVDSSFFGLDGELIGDAFEDHDLVEAFLGADIFGFIVILLPPFLLAGFDELNLQRVVRHFLSCNFEVDGVVLLFQIGVADHVVVGVYLIVNQIFPSGVAVESFGFDFARNLDDVDSDLFHVFVSVGEEVVFGLVDLYSVFFYLFLFQVRVVAYVREADGVLLFGQGVVEDDDTQFEYFHIFFLYFLEEGG